MARYIDADVLLEDIRKNSMSYFADDFAHEWVDKQPTADVRENVHGEWIERCQLGDGYGATCNKCGKYCPLHTDDRNFCPNCGADMRTKNEV